MASLLYLSIQIIHALQSCAQPPNRGEREESARNDFHFGSRDKPLSDEDRMHSAHQAVCPTCKLSLDQFPGPVRAGRLLLRIHQAINSLGDRVIESSLQQIAAICFDQRCREFAVRGPIGDLISADIGVCV